MPSSAGRCTLTPPDPQLKGAWFQTLHLSREKPVSRFAFQNATCTATPRGARTPARTAEAYHSLAIVHVFTPSSQLLTLVHALSTPHLSCVKTPLYSH
jgi:hypothetical protein